MTSSSRVSVALASVISAVALFAAAPTTASAATVPTAHVTIQMFAFTPSNLTAHLGTLVVWTNKDSTAHTTTSDQGFWGSPHIGTGGTYSRTFNQAGTYTYHCAIHPSMHGTVSVPMRGSARVGGATLVWALSSGTYDVQVERPRSTTWAPFVTGTTSRSISFTTSHFGTYHFRARTHGSSADSGWSPSLALSIE
jgi:plastocyanin